MGRGLGKTTRVYCFVLCLKLGVVRWEIFPVAEAIMLCCLDRVVSLVILATGMFWKTSLPSFQPLRIAGMGIGLLFASGENVHEKCALSGRHHFNSALADLVIGHFFPILFQQLPKLHYLPLHKAQARNIRCLQTKLRLFHSSLFWNKSHCDIDQSFFFFFLVIQALYETVMTLDVGKLRTDKPTIKETSTAPFGEGFILSLLLTFFCFLFKSMNLDAICGYYRRWMGKNICSLFAMPLNHNWRGLIYCPFIPFVILRKVLIIFIAECRASLQWNCKLKFRNNETAKQVVLTVNQTRCLIFLNVYSGGWEPNYSLQAFDRMCNVMYITILCSFIRSPTWHYSQVGMHRIATPNVNICGSLVKVRETASKISGYCFRQWFQWCLFPVYLLLVFDPFKRCFCFHFFESHSELLKK